MIVVDASAIGTFLIPDEDGAFGAFAKQICLTEEIQVPAHWAVEVASLLRKANRRGRLTDEQAAEAAAIADRLAASILLPVTPPISVLWAQSRRLGLTCYDAAYYLLAETLDCPLLTDDGALRRVALREGLQVLAS